MRLLRFFIRPQVWGITLLITIMAGCANIQHLSNTGVVIAHRQHIQNQNYLEAESAVQQLYEPSGRNRLLYHLELGMLAHLQGEYQRSNDYFETAERWLGHLYTVSLSNQASAFLLGSLERDYRGFIYENIFLYYFKALNYIKLAEIEADFDEQQLDAAIVEVRRLTLKLDQLAAKTGSYKASQQARSSSSFGQVFNVLSQTLADRIDSDELLYRDDGFAHYISGLLFEMTGELDSARIEYHKAASIYQDGFAEQYGLSGQGAKQAWFDTIRMMILAGGYEDQWPQLAKQKLTDQQRADLGLLAAKPASLMILQHLDLTPKREQLELVLTLEPSLKQLTLRPVPTGSSRTRAAQLEWFAMLYGEVDILGLMNQYARGEIGHGIGLFSKTIPLAPLWSEAKKIGLPQALQFPTRITVPYYPQADFNFTKTELWVDGHYQGDLMTAESIASIALQEQLRIANKEILLALSSALVKSISAQQLSEEAGSNLILFAVKALDTVTSAADTRNWASLPAAVKFKRLQVEPGEHQILLKTHLKSGAVIEQTSAVITSVSRPALLHQRTFTN